MVDSKLAKSVQKSVGRAKEKVGKSSLEFEAIT